MQFTLHVCLATVLKLGNQGSESPTSASTQNNPSPLFVKPEMVRILNFYQMKLRLSMESES